MDAASLIIGDVTVWGSMAHTSGVLSVLPAFNSGLGLWL